jgi:hypothetical protein
MNRYDAVGKAPHAADLYIRCGWMITHPNLLSVEERDRCTTWFRSWLGLWGHLHAMGKQKKKHYPAGDSFQILL